MKWIAPAVLAAGCSQVFGLDRPILARGDAPRNDARVDAAGCTIHAQCGSPGACLPDGSCGTDANVAWVAQSGSDSGTCTMTMPCATITKALEINKPYIKVATGTISDQVTIARAVTILADDGAKVTSATVGSVVTVAGTAAVEVHDLRITQSTSNAIAVDSMSSPTLTLVHVVVDSSSGFGLNIAGGSLVMSRCIVSGNIGGGATITAVFDITNSLFVANGSPTSTTGGLSLSAANSNSVLRFDTVADNISSSGTAAVRGINCTTPLSVTDDIITGNPPSTNCLVDYSLLDTGTASGHNKSGSPDFRNTSSADPTASDYYRIGPTSAAIDSADPASTLTFDIDRISRPQGASFDIGASEYKP